MKTRKTVPTQAQREQWAAERAAKIDRAEALLREGLGRLQTSAGWLEMLRQMSRWGRFSPARYSFANQLRVWVQAPGCEAVGTYKAWQAVGRQVKKGERGIIITQPKPWTHEVERDDGTTDKRAGMSFAPLSVFDLRQTEGDDFESPYPAMPDVAGQDFHHSVDELRAVAVALPEVAGVELRARRVGDPSAALGWYTPATRTIVVATDGRTPVQQFHTLVHEVAHALLHPEGDRHSTPIREVEAESTAYVVCTSLGLDVDACAFNYVAVWGNRNAGDRDAANLVAQCGERIRRASARLLDAVLGETMAEGEEAA